MNIIRNRNKFFLISLTIIVIGLVMAAVNGLNVGIDFTGGTLLQIDFGKKVPVNEIRKITDEFDKNASILHVGDNKEQVIIKTTLDLDNKDRIEIFNKFKEKYNLKDEAFVQSQKFGPSIGKEIRTKALLSVLIATIGMLIYITFRFEFKFGISAIVALVHDVLITFSVYAIFQIPVNNPFVAAMLTIVGYSINDTIVVFDRIRENIKIMKKDKYEDIVNKSISQTIVRSINTSFTTLLVIVVLYIFGVEAIKDFALPLIVGIIAGTYSSIFIASPIWYLLRTRVSDRNNYNPNRV
ncbi:protein translocase subunit SecF [Caloranaerobacter azorensis]|uniref:Protein-export membrane protein SecF n=2 Tax=Caloranaerobacter azorensis TaxID=116090 RepID=A0A1M5TQY0_9FIRM|nr:protein translocase subunit SecF [Caloranaerobacter azorensis]QIB26537.1 protein translocase subunit SecF [Caloranaerobacter azorensis]SHH53070.1 protein translocase subunit secF [Caloranaerobacter azorensis DSM 13643]